MFDSSADPGHDGRYCDGLSAEPADDARFSCLLCGQWSDDDTTYPYCSPECVAGIAEDEPVHAESQEV